jgi:methyl-accepting chemotaxis protein
MRIHGRLIRSALAVAVAGSVVAAWMLQTALPLAPPLAAFLWRAFAVATAVELAVVALLLRAVARPLRRTGPASESTDEGAARSAAQLGHRLPVATAVILLLVSAVSTSVIVARLRAAGLAPDLALAALGMAIAASILTAMLGYSLATAAAAQLFEALGARGEVAVRGTVRGKILALGLGLNTIGVLLFAATGYVRYRADVDREYVGAAARAQESAIAAGSGKRDPELAQHVWLVTSSPSALLGPAGGIVARFGGAAVSFDRARGAPLGPLRLDEGWLLTRRAPGGGVLVSWLPEAPLWPRRREFWNSLSSMGLVVYAAAALLAFLAARAITIPFRTLGRAADRIASGDLTASPPSLSRDEMGQLAADFRRMAHGLKALVVDVQAASEGVSLGAREAGAIGERVRSGALDQHAGVVSMQTAVEAMEGSVLLVSRGVDGLSDYVSATAAAMGEIASAIEAVHRKGVELERAMDSAMRDVESLGGAGRDAEVRLGELEQLAGHAGGTLTTVKTSMADLERAAVESEATAGLVAEVAERAGGVVQETVYGIETLRAAVSDAHRRITSLGRRSDDIGQVVEFISEVAGRTNLLSLNASIIAAQAGEHGKAFAVVADQIRDLAAQIARSTKSIGDIIHSVREDVEGTTALVDRGDALAVEGVQLARNSLEALAQIQRSTVHGRDTAAAIRAAVEAHGRSYGEVASLVESVADGSRAVSAAVQLVGRSVAGVNAVSRSVSAMADQVARALEEQTGLGQRQIESLGRLERMIADITRAVENHGSATRRVRDALQNLSQTAGAHESAVEGLSGVSERLGSRAKALAERVGRFKV